MLKVIHTSGLPYSLPVHPAAEFQSGMVAQLGAIGNDIIGIVSDGTAPLGIIDDVKTNSFSATSIDEIIEIDNVESTMDINGYLVSVSPVVGFLNNPSLLEGTFVADMSVELNAKNGAVTVPAETRLNYDYDEDGTLDGFKIVASYTYRIANKPGDDTTIGSGRMAIHYSRGFYATDQYDTLAVYPLNAPLFVGLDGKFTTRQPTANHPSVCFVTGPPSAIDSMLEFFWL